MKSQPAYSPLQMLKFHRDIRLKFTEKNRIKFGCIQLVRKFLRHLKVEEELGNAVLIEKRESKFRVGEIKKSPSMARSAQLIKKVQKLLYFRLDKNLFFVRK